MNDLALLHKWRIERDAGAFKEIVTRHSGMVFGTCQRILGNAQDAEDVSQECFELLATNRGNPSDHLGGWLHSAARNRSLNRLRSEKRRRTREAKFDVAPEIPATNEWNEIYRCVDDALEELPEALRVTLIASFLESETNVAIARELGLSPSAVAYRIDKGIGLLRKSLQKKGIGVSLASLSTLMTAHAASAAPAKLTLTLGKLALAGAGPAAVPTVSSTAYVLGGMLIVKKTIIGIAAVVLLASLAFIQLIPSTEEKGHAQNATGQVAPALTPSTPDVFQAGRDIASVLPGTTEHVTTQFPSETIRVTGRVIDNQESPISGAHVEAICSGIDLNNWKAADWSEMMSRPTADNATISDSDGTFAIDAMCPPGRVLLRATATGFIPRGKLVDYSPGITSDPIVLKLIPGPIAFSGQVLEARGAPVTDAYVATKTWGMNGSSRPNTSAFTNANGHFVLLSAAEGLSTIQVVSTSLGKSTFTDILIEHGGFVQLRFPAQPTILHGNISWNDGSPATGARVRLVGDFVQLQYDADGQATGGYASNEGDTLRINIDENGYYRTDQIDPGQTYTVYVIGSDGQALTPREKLGKLTTGIENRWDTKLTRLIALTVTVVGERSGQPIPNVTLLCAKITKDGGPSRAIFSAISNADGRCELAITSGPGAYGLRLFYSDSGTVMTSPGMWFHHEFNLGDDDIDITLKVPESATLRCLVVDRDGAPISGVKADTLVQRNDGIHTRNMKVASTGPDGRLEVMAEPDTVIQCILSHNDYASALTREYIFEPGANWEETVVLYPSASLALSLVDPNNAALANTSVALSIILPNGTERTLELKTDEYGELLIEDNIPATRIAIRIQATIETDGSMQELHHRTGEFDVVSGQITELNTIRLEQ